MSCNLCPSRECTGVLLALHMMLTRPRCGPIKLAKALVFCFERSQQLDVLARSLVSQPKLLDELAQRHHLPSLLPTRPTPIIEIGQVTLAAESLNIQSIGFVTSSLTRTLTPPPVAILSAIGEPAQLLGPKPNVLIVDDNPINVSVKKFFSRIVKWSLTTTSDSAHGSGRIPSEEEIPIYQGREWAPWCPSCDGIAGNLRCHPYGCDLPLSVTSVC